MLRFAPLDPVQEEAGGLPVLARRQWRRTAARQNAQAAWNEITAGALDDVKHSGADLPVPVGFEGPRACPASTGLSHASHKTKARGEQCPASRLEPPASARAYQV
jgi:hypothetical protein